MLSREGVDARTLGRIFVAVVQEVIIYRSDMWLMTPRIGRVLGGFHHRVARRMTGRQPRRGRCGTWVYPLLEDAMAEAGLLEVDTYLYHLQNIVLHFIATRPIMDLCLTDEWSPGSRVSKRWW